MTERVDAILLASGFSERFGGENKLTRLFRGKSLVEHALALFCTHPGISGVHLVYADPAVGALAAGFSAHVICNERPERGVCESVRLGVLASSAAYYLFAHCDQPLLDAGVITAILARRRPETIVVPSRDGAPSNPALFAASFRGDLLALADRETPRMVKKKFAKQVVHVAIEPPWRLLDADTPEELNHMEHVFS